MVCGAGYKLPQIGVHGERQWSQSTVGWLFSHTGWLLLLNLGGPRTVGTNSPGQDCFSWSHRAITKVESLDAKTWPGLKRKKNAKSLPLWIGTWNVQTMQTGLDSMDLSHSHIRKTAVTDRQLSRLNLDIVAQQETRIAGSGSLKKENYTFSGET